MGRGGEDGPFGPVFGGWTGVRGGPMAPLGACLKCGFLTLTKKNRVGGFVVSEGVGFRL